MTARKPSSGNTGGHPLESDALRVNLRNTAVARVDIDPRHVVLRQVVRDYAGITDSLDILLKELNHPFRNWPLILPDLKGFVLKNWSLYQDHDLGPNSFDLFRDFFFQALEGKESHLREVLEGLTAFLERVVTRITPGHLSPYAPCFDRLFQALTALPDRHLFLLSQSHYPLPRSLGVLLAAMRQVVPPAPTPDPRIMRDLLRRCLEISCDYWLRSPDPATFFAPDRAGAVQTISHHALRTVQARLRTILTPHALPDHTNLSVADATTPHPESPTPPDNAHLPAMDAAARLLELPTFLDIVRGYRQAATELGRQIATRKSPAETENRTLAFLFHIMETEGLGLIHEETLREINRTLVHLVRMEQTPAQIREVFLRTFQFLKVNVGQFPNTALQSIEALGTEVFLRNQSGLVEMFLEEVVRFGFQYSAVQGVDIDWQPVANPSHLYNVRVWLSLILQHPKWCSTLLSALIINLHLTGTCIKDTDLFQKEITRILNSEIEPVFNLIKQLARLLPVYFNEIGAEGELRNVSTDLDELTQRQDRMVHFLRKQCHVESTNLTVGLTAAILRFWHNGDKTPLQPYMPASLLEDIPVAGPLFDGVHQVVARVCEQSGLADPTELLNLPLDAALPVIMGGVDLPETARRRVAHLLHLYQMLHRKYNLGFQGIHGALRDASFQGFPHLDRLLADLDAEVDNETLLATLLDVLEGLREIILSREVFPVREEIYQKRHIAVGIPSIYGQYRERKFDALSMTFRLENLANVCLERLLETIPDGFITQAGFRGIARQLHYFLRALAVDGITSRKLQDHLVILEDSLRTRQLTFYQYMDLFRGFSEGVKSIIETNYASHHRDNLALIVTQVPKEKLLPRYLALRSDDLPLSLEQISEVFFRDLIAGTFGLQALDRFLARILKVLAAQQQNLDPRGMDLLMTYNPERLFRDIHATGQQDRNLMLLGGKGFNLTQMADLGFPVPPGTVLTTEFFRCRQIVRHYQPAWNDFLQQLRTRIHTIETRTGKKFGQTTRPLLLSVRSGASISMPGMMQTIHNVGINREIVAGIIRESGNPFFAWDNYRRFIQSWAMSFDMGRSVFSDLMRQTKRRHGIERKKDLTAAQMQELADAYEAATREMGIVIPEDPWEQLLASIQQVVQSWNALKAKDYRRILGIANDWGTAVVLQTMIFGNVSQESGTGVLFTANPGQRLSRVMLWGDFTPGNQGEDIVGGLVATQPVSVEQCLSDGRDPNTSLERCFPEIHAELLRYAKTLIYDQRWSPQEIEFTFDGPRLENLWLLQTRDMATTAEKTHVVRRFKVNARTGDPLLAQGIGVSGGALCGRAVFNLDQIQSLRAEDPDTPLILIRYDTVPEDIKEIYLTQGLLTARGGQTSHASIVAARLKKTCVVGCEALNVRGAERDHGELGGHPVRCGDRISLDGRRGLVLAGWHEVESTVVGVKSDQ
ncbi:MAG: PEP-utilizing enzyme [Magnetococcus sp. DMHC-1]|nr:phosphoenolpyruvate synthase [Magnetococcales bacterium]